jgi:tRNA (guanine26-N2/guanine27-N2)-dimethyltransferase
MPRVREGQVVLEVPELELFRAPTGDYVPSRAPVFYNPHMEPSRDVAVAVAQAVQGELGGLRVCDPLAGVGARGIRYAVEVRGTELVVLNDRSERAQEFLRRNVQLNPTDTRIELERRDANALLFERRGHFNWVELDPFGSPAPFLEAACAALRRRGVLALTATDTAPLCGAHPRACLRRYGARPLRTEYCHELGMRILVGFAQRVAGKHGLALEPVLAHATRHYFRVYLMARRGKALADRVLQEQGYVEHCFACGRRRAVRGLVPVLERRCACGSDLAHAGPLWLGRMADRRVAERAAGEVAERGFRRAGEEVRLLRRLAEEADGAPLHYTVDELARRIGRSPVSPERVVERLRARGFSASRTHFTPSGFRTDAPWEAVVEACGGEGHL